MVKFYLGFLLQNNVTKLHKKCEVFFWLLITFPLYLYCSDDDNNKTSNIMTELPIGLVRKSFLEHLNEFIDYVCKFYELDGGQHPTATREEIENAIGYYLTQPHEFEIEFDSIDREKIYELLTS